MRVGWNLGNSEGDMSAVQEHHPLLVLLRASYRNVMSYKDVSEEFLESNWFASEMNETESLLFYALVPKEKVDFFFQLVADFNAQQSTKAKVQVAVLNIEKTN